MAILGTRTSSSRTDHLERVVHQLEARGDRRALIRIVERWIASGTPPREVRLAEARAFLDLRLMDRAWLRLKELTDQDASDLEASVLTARMFIERGWPVRARRLLQQALEREPARKDLHALLVSAHQPPLQPPANGREVERQGSFEDQLALAERFLAAGSQLRAKSILERLRRNKGAVAARADELLWGMSGDFGGGPADPLLLARQLLPTEQLDAPDAPMDLEPVESVMDDVTSTGSHLPRVDGEHGEGESFPSLFRALPEGLDLNDFNDDSDVTSITKMAKPGDLSRMDTAEVTDPGRVGDDEDDGDDGDTQVMMVIPQSRSFREQIELEKAEAAGGETRNLRDAGGGAVQFDAPVGEVELDDSEMEFDDDFPLGRLHDGDMDEDDLLEDEDEDLIVMTRKEPGFDTSLPPDVGIKPSDIEISQIPMEVVEVNPPPRNPEAPEPPPPTTPMSRYLEEPDPRSFRSPAQRLFPLVAMVALALLAINLLMQRGAEVIRAAAIYSEVTDALSRASYRGLQESEVRLEQFQDEEERLASHLAGLALVKLMLWSDYTGGPARLQAADDLIAQADALDNDDELLLLTRGWRAYLIGDEEQAERLLMALAPDDPEVLLLSAVVAAQVGRGEEALADIARAVELAPDKPRYLLGQAKICLNLNDAACARAAAAKAKALVPDEPAVAVVALEVDTSAYVLGTASVAAAARAQAASMRLVPDEVSAEVALEADAAARRSRESLGAVEAFIAGMDQSVPPRVAGRAHFLHYSLLRAARDDEAADEAMELAVAADPSNPSYLYHHTVDFLVKGQVRSALKDAETCVANQPNEWRYQAALVWTLLAMDRVEEVRAHLEGMPEEMQSHLRSAVLSAALSLADDDPAGALALLNAPALENDPEAIYLRSLARGEQGEDSSGALLEVARELAVSSEPLLQILAPRARAAAMLYGDPARPFLLETSKALSASTDPIVHTTLGAVWEKRGDRRRAATAFDRAADLGEEPALAHYLRGQFYINPRDDSETIKAWRTYLDQDPSGPRAERARQRIR